MTWHLNSHIPSGDKVVRLFIFSKGVSFEDDNAPIHITYVFVKFPDPISHQPERVVVSYSSLVVKPLTNDVLFWSICNQNRQRRAQTINPSV